MLSLPYGFSSNVRRSGHAACWCPPLDGIVQFGGWPCSAELSRTLQQDGSNCPLYLLTARAIVKGVERAEHTKSSPSSPTMGMSETVAATVEVADEYRESQKVDWLNDSAPQLLQRGRGKPQRKIWLTAGREQCMNTKSGENMMKCCKDVACGGVAEQERRQTAQADNASGRSNEREEADESEAESIRYDDGYQSEPSDFSHVMGEEGEGEEESNEGGAGDGSSSSVTSPTAVSLSAAADGAVVAPVVTAELLRALGSDMMSESALPQIAAAIGGEGTNREEGSQAPHASNHSNEADNHNRFSSASPPTSFHGAASTNTATTASHLPAVLLSSRRAIGVGELFREAPPITADVEVIPGKRNTAPLRWRAIRAFIAPRSRHGHHLVYHDGSLYVIGGSYWAHGNALATTDMSYDLRTKSWHQLNSLFPPRFSAAVATSNLTLVASPPQSAVAAGGSSSTQTILYAFGGLDYTQQLTATLHRLWLPTGALQELPQYGATPRKQFKGLLVCDVQRELTVEELWEGQCALGRLFYMDGFQDGRPMAPALRYYSLATGFWVKVCSCPDLVRAQVAGVWWQAPGPRTTSNDLPSTATSPKEETEDGANHGREATAARPLHRFDVFGGMPSRRGHQRRSRVCYSFDTNRQTFDYANPLPVPGLTAHCIVPLPVKESLRGEESVWLRRLRDHHGISALSCGGNEDLNQYEQNSLGEPVSWVYLFRQREIPLAEQARVYIETHKIPYKIILAPKKDELLDELF